MILELESFREPSRRNLFFSLQPSIQVYSYLRTSSPPLNSILIVLFGFIGHKSFQWITIRRESQTVCRFLMADHLFEDVYLETFGGKEITDTRLWLLFHLDDWNGEGRISWPRDDIQKVPAQTLQMWIQEIFTYIGSLRSILQRVDGSFVATWIDFHDCHCLDMSCIQKVKINIFWSHTKWRRFEEQFALKVFRSIKPIFVWFSPCIGSPFKSWVLPGRNTILTPSGARGEARVGANESSEVRRASKDSGLTST
jgi:hypothetical protein